MEGLHVVTFYGSMEGLSVGVCDGASDGSMEVLTVGTFDGTLDSRMEGLTVDTFDGTSDGIMEGLSGLPVGTCDGTRMVA